MFKPARIIFISILALVLVSFVPLFSILNSLFSLPTPARAEPNPPPESFSSFWVDTSSDVLFTEQTNQFITEKSPNYVVLNARLQADNALHNYENVISRLKDENPALKTLGYTWFTKAHDTSNDYPRIGGFFWPYVAGREDFFLHDTDGSRLLSFPDYPDFYCMDVSNTDYQAVFLQALEDFYAGYPQLDGIVLDSTLYYPPGGYVDIYGEDDFYQNYHIHVHSMLQRIKQRFPNKLLFFNGLSMNHLETGGTPTEEYLDVVDGAFIEFFCSYYGYKPLDFSFNVEPYINIMNKYKDSNKVFIAHGRTGQYQIFSQEFEIERYCLASFLLGKTGNSYFNFLRSHQTTINTDNDHSGLTYYDNQDLDLGASLEDYFDENEIYQRRFEKGVVLVASGDSQGSQSVTLDRNYYDLDGVYYSVGTAVTLNPVESKIFLTYSPCNNNGVCDGVENVNSCGQDCGVVLYKDFETPPEYQLPFQLDVEDDSVSREYSSELQSNIIKVDYSKADVGKWYQKWHFEKLDRIYRVKSPEIFSFKIKTSDPGIAIRFNLHADNGELGSAHFPVITFVPGPRNYAVDTVPGYVRIGIGEDIADGTWKTVTLNLTEELRKSNAFRDYTIYRADTLSISGSFEIDDISLSYTAPPFPGDTDGDGDVDEEDLNLLKQDYLGAPAHNTDFNSDGRVDCEDFAILQANYSN